MLRIVSRDSDMNEYMSSAFMVQDVLGLFQSGSKFPFTRPRIVVFLIVAVLLFISGIIQLTKIYHDFSHFNDILSLVWFGMMGLSKYSTLLYHRRRVTELRDRINDNKINDDSSTSDDAILANYDKTGHYYGRIMTYASFTVGFGIFLQNMPKFFRTKVLTLPIEIYYPFNLDETGWFILAYFHQFLAYTIQVLIFTAAFTQFISLTYHSCGHFHVLQNYLERIAEDENWVEYRGMGVRDRVKKCVKLHQNIIRLIGDLEDFHTWPNLIHFLVSAVGLCTSAYELSSGDLTPEQILKHTCGIVGQFLQLYAVNYCGQLIQDKCHEVSKAVYRANFYILEPCCQKDLMFILIRAQKPVYITAGKFCNLSMENIINILKATTTYFAMFATLDSQSDD